MLFLNKGHTRLNTSQVWAGFILILLSCLLSMFFIDRAVLLLVHNQLPMDWKVFFEKITRLGKGDIWISGSFCIALGGYIMNRSLKKAELRQQCMSISRKALFVLLSLLFSGLLLNIIKTMIGRLRPSHFLAEGTYSFQPFNLDFGMNAFPSGHSQAIWAVMISLSLLFPRYTVAFVSFATLVAASRVLVSAHYVSDVLMGSYIGMLLAFYLYTWFIRKGYLTQK